MIRCRSPYFRRLRGFRLVSLTGLLACVSLSLLFTGCGDNHPANSGGGGGGSNPAPTVSISANPASIASGGSSTLTVTAANATQVTVTGTDGSSYTLSATGGTQAVTPTNTTTYTATATGAGGKITATVIVTVGTAAAPTVTVIANPTSVASGGSSTLTVAATNADQVTLTGTDGSSYTMQPDGGTQVVKPTATTTYTATASAGGVKVTASTVVTVVAAVTPTVTISASPTSIASGASSTLTVKATNATTVTVTGTDGSSYTLQPSGGAPSVSPAATTTYTATANGPGGKATATATVTVAPNPVPTVALTANPTSIATGSSSILTVTASNATQVTLTGTDGSKYTLAASGGTQAVSPASSTTYTAAATGPGGTTTATATLTVTSNPPPTVTITANPTSVVSGGSSTLTVTSTNANQVVITGSDGSTYTLASTSATQTVNPTATTTYTATATGAGGTKSATATVTVSANPVPTVSITANPISITPGNPSTLTVTASNATQVTITGTDGSSYTLPTSGGTQSVSPTSTTTYTVTATNSAGKSSDEVTVSVGATGINSINHVIFMMQENHSFDNYFGMLNPYRVTNGWTKSEDGNTYTIDGIDDKLNTISNTDDEGDVYKLFKLKSTCIDDDSSAWESSFGDVAKYERGTNRSITMNGFVHNSEGFAKACVANGNCDGAYTDVTGERAMGYYDQDVLNYYYYMASQFAVSDRWFSPVASKTVSNRIATLSGGTTQGLVQDPGSNDKLGTLGMETIFQELDNAHVSWKLYYTSTDGACLSDEDCAGAQNAAYPAIYFSHFAYEYRFVHGNPGDDPTKCTAPLQPSSVVGDTKNTFCIDPTHVAPLSQYFIDLTNGTLPSFAFIEGGYGVDDEHPGSTGSVLTGQRDVAKMMNALMASPEWKDSVFFFAYDEGGGPYDHVPPVPGHTNDFTNTSALGATPPDISSISVNPDLNSSKVAINQPCVPPPATTTTGYCDLPSTWPGSVQTDVAANPGGVITGRGFGAQLGFRIPNMVLSPFVRKHYVSHIPMDHTAIIKFVEDRFIGPNAHLTNRDAAQPNLLDFFDFTNPPWMTPPTPPTPVAPGTGSIKCNAASMGP